MGVETSAVRRRAGGCAADRAGDDPLRAQGRADRLAGHRRARPADGSAAACRHCGLAPLPSRSAGAARSSSPSPGEPAAWIAVRRLRGPDQPVRHGRHPARCTRCTPCCRSTEPFTPGDGPRGRPRATRAGADAGGRARAAGAARGVRRLDRTRHRRLPCRRGGARAPAATTSRSTGPRPGCTASLLVPTRCPLDVLAPGTHSTRRSLGGRRAGRARPGRRSPVSATDHAAAHGPRPGSVAAAGQCPRRDGRAAAPRDLHAHRSCWPSCPASPATGASASCGCWPPRSMHARPGPAESVLRLHWNERPPADPCPGDAGRRRTPAGPPLPGGRPSPVRGGAAHQVSADDLVALEGSGLAGRRTRPRSACSHGDPISWTKHLEREFHQHLLAQTG